MNDLIKKAAVAYALYVAIYGGFLLIGRDTTSSADLSRITLKSQYPESTNVWEAMSDQEILDVFDFIKNFVERNIELPQSNPLWNIINAISNKYGIFT